MGYVTRWIGKSLIYWILPIVWLSVLLPIVGPRVLAIGEKIPVDEIVSFTINDVTYTITIETLLTAALLQFVPVLILFMLTEQGFPHYGSKIIWKSILYLILLTLWSVMLLPIIGPIIMTISETVPIGKLFEFTIKGVTYAVTPTTLVIIALYQVIPALILIILIEQGRNGGYEWRITWKTLAYWSLITCWSIIILPVFGPVAISVGQQISIQSLFSIVIGGATYTMTFDEFIQMALIQLVPVLILFGLSEIGHPEKQEEEPTQEEPT